MGIEIEFLRCVRHIEIAFAEFINARIQNEFDEYSCGNCVSHSTNHSVDIRKVSSSSPPLAIAAPNSSEIIFHWQLQTTASDIHTTRFPANCHPGHAESIAGATAEATATTAATKFHATNSIVDV